MNTMNADDLMDALRELAYRVEKIPASTEQTNAITLLTDLRAAIGGIGEPCEYAKARVLAAIRGDARHD